MDTTQLVGLGPIILALALTVVVTVYVLNKPVALAFLTARLAEPSTKGALIFCASAIQGLMTGALDWKGFTLVMIQGLYHILQPDSPAGVLMSSALSVSEWQPAPVDLSESAKQHIADVVAAAVRPVTPVALLICLTLALSACSGLTLTGDVGTDLTSASTAITSADTTAQQNITAIAKLTAEDLQDAIADAHANSDTAAESCYTAILPVVQAQASAKAPVVGGVSAFQRARDVVKLFKGQGAVALACAALKQDVTGDVLGIATLFGMP